MPFIKGADPFAGLSQEPIRLLETITAAQLASCVPLVRIEKIDRLGRPATDVRPLMFDLAQTPQFSGMGDFGNESDVFIERAVVSLLSLRVESDMQYGLMLFRDIGIEFMVHRPDVVFDRSSGIAWREILEEGKSFSLEYGWTADSGLVQNPLFNGHGMVTGKGTVVKSTSAVLLTVYSYRVRYLATGEVAVSVKAKENGDLALRLSKFSDDFEGAFGPANTPFARPITLDDSQNVARLKQLIDRLERFPGRGRAQYYRMGDVLDQIIAPMIDVAAKNFGYCSGPTDLSIAGASSVPPGPAVLLLGRFNEGSGPQSDRFMGKAMAGQGIEEFMIPRETLLDALSLHLSEGRALYLTTLVNLIVNQMNADVAWAHPSPGSSYRKPEVMLKSDTVRNPDGTFRLVMVVYDRKTGTDPFGQRDGNDDRNFIALQSQSKSAVMAKLKSLDVPVIEFGRAGSLILDASFEFQPEPLLQAIQVDAAYRDRKDRVQQTSMPDVESRKGQSRSGELTIPVSIVEGAVTMYGNFAVDVFALMWVEFFGSSEISGVFHVIGKVDSLEPGKFTSEFKLISEGLDPMNTRRRRTDSELSADRARSAAVTSKK